MGGRCITGVGFWGGKGLESEKDVLEEKELLGVNIIGIFLSEELLGLIRLLVCLSLLLKAIIIVPSVLESSSYYKFEKYFVIAFPLPLRKTFPSLVIL